MNQASSPVQGSNWHLDHVGHAVNDMDKALKRYQVLFNFSLELREREDEHLVELAFLQLDNSTIELIAPYPENEGLLKYLGARGECLHHVCFRVPSVSEELERLDALGVQLIDSKPRPGPRGMEIAFIHPRELCGVMIELCSPTLDEHQP